MMISNKHHLTIETRATDFERVEDIGADAIRATRTALEWCSRLSGDEAHDFRREIADLRQIVERRSALTRDGRHSLRAFRTILLAQGQDGPDATPSPLVAALSQAFAGSERVADLVAAERHVGHCRGIG